MAYDLFLGIIPKSWARGTPAVQSQPVADESTAACTPEEKAKLEKIALIRMKMESGDKKAQRQWKAALAGIPALKTRASRGDLKARRTLQILKESKILEKSGQKFNITGWSLFSSPTYDDGWKHAKDYGKAVEAKDAKAANKVLSWMKDNGWKVSASSGSAPFFSNITWVNPKFKAKIGVDFPNNLYQVSRIEGSLQVSPRKPWVDSESDIKVGPRKTWTDSDPTVKVGPRKQWEDDETDKTIARAKKGDVSAQIALRKIAAREAADREEMPMSGKIGSSHYIEIQGAFIGDESRAQREDRLSMGNDLSHNEYRALIMRQAAKNAGRGKPDTRHFFSAKSSVDKTLGNAGISIYIPGARPGRRTV